MVGMAQLFCCANRRAKPSTSGRSLSLSPYPSTEAVGYGSGNVILETIPFCLTMGGIQLNLKYSVDSVQK